MDTLKGATEQVQEALDVIRNSDNISYNIQFLIIHLSRYLQRRAQDKPGSYDLNWMRTHLGNEIREQVSTH